MTLLEKIQFEEDWLSEVNLTKQNIKIAFAGIRATAQEQQPKTGHWIAEINDYGEITHWHCDKCYEDSGFTTTCKWDFCPSCGIKMIEPQKSEEEGE